MSIITLTTDYGLKDYFVGAVKGKIYSRFSDAKIIDISHDILPFNISQASYVIGAAYKHFPDGTVHIIALDIEQSNDNQHLVVYWNKQYFICANNGILSLLLQIVEINTIYEINSDFYLQNGLEDIDVFVNAACYLSNKGDINAIAKPFNDLKQVTALNATISNDGNNLKGMVVYMDNYGNAVTNISRELFNFHSKGRSFEISFKEKSITTISKKYSDIHLDKSKPQNFYHGEKLALFNDAGFLEIAIFKSSPSTGSAKTMFGFVIGNFVSINFT